MGLRGVKKDIPKVWISEEGVKNNNIEYLEDELFAQNLVIDRQRQTIEELRRKLNTKKSIVADWLETPVLSQKYTKGLGNPDAH